MVQETTKNITIDVIQKAVVDYFKISLAELRGKRRNKNIVYARQIAMLLSRQLTNLSLPEIGNAFGGKDHTTVLHACKKTDQDLKVNSELKNAVQNITNILKH